MPKEAISSIGPYAVLAKIAEGGMARIYLAKHRSSTQVCVVKQLRQELEEHAIATVRFRREAAIASRIVHPNVARILDSGFDAGRFYIAVEFIAGQTVESLMKEEAVIPRRIAIAIMVAVLDGLFTAHEAKDEGGRPLSVVHRDICPRNIMISYDGRVKIIDFGIARAEIDDFRTSPGMVVGSVGHMSPEQVLTTELDARSDLYSVGVVLYELLTGRTIFPPCALEEALMRIVRDTPPPAGSINPDIPKGLEKLVMKAIAKFPEDRFQSAAEFLDQLRAPWTERATRGDISAFVRSRFASQERETTALLEEVDHDFVISPDSIHDDDVGAPVWSLDETVCDADLFEDPTEVV